MNVVKNLKFLMNLSLFQKGLDMIVGWWYSGQKISLSRLQNCYYEIVEIFAFFLEGGEGGGFNPYTPHFGQKLKILPNLLPIRKSLDMMFDDVVDKKEVFLDYKNVTLR